VELVLPATGVCATDAAGGCCRWTRSSLVAVVEHKSTEIGHRVSAPWAISTIWSMSIFEQRDHVFVDESKSRGYVLAAATVSPEDAAQTDKDLRGL